MTWLALANHVGDVSPVGAPYIGGGSWGGWRASSRVRSTLYAWSLTCSSWGATSGRVERRRNRAEVLTGRGRTSRSRRTGETRAAKAARERGWDGARRGGAAGSAYDWARGLRP